MRIAVLGVGLIGGSIGLAARELAEDVEVVGYGRDPGRLRTALERGAIGRAADSPAAAVEDADICFDWVSTRMMEGPAKSENAVFGSRATVSQ